MRDSRNSDGSALVIAMVMLLLLLVGGGVAFMWQRHQAMAAQQEALMQAERAAAEAARAEALTRQQLAEPATTASAASVRPNGIGDNQDSVEAAIRNVIETQQRAWNAGDIDQFMESYWQSADLTFSSGGKLTRSWQGTLENYRKRYPSRTEMGDLAFQNLEVTPLGSEAALVLGEWQLSRDSDGLGGNFTLVFRRIGGKWLIIHDHTSRTGKPE